MTGWDCLKGGEQLFALGQTPVQQIILSVAPREEVS
jgi:hypothetical protein